MNILYGIQGTGHGHISRAREIVPLLSENADVDVLISGYNCNMELGGVEIIRKRGVSLAYNDKGSVSLLKTILKLKPDTFIRDLNSLDVENYDLIISDYEPVTAWAARRANAFSVGLSHQASFRSEMAPRPAKTSIVGEQILKYFAPSSKSIGFHFKRYDSFVLPPIIRRDVRNLSPRPGNHVTVYLPAFSHKVLVQYFNHIPGTDWHIFSPDCRQIHFKDNVMIHPVDNLSFLESMENSLGVITGAGFETCAEAMFLGKKLLAIPISNQYEQYCNEAALKQMGVQTVQKIEGSFLSTVQNWIQYSKTVQLDEIAETDKLADLLFRLANDNEIDYSSEEIVEERSPALVHMAG